MCSETFTVCNLSDFSQPQPTDWCLVQSKWHVLRQDSSVFLTTIAPVRTKKLPKQILKQSFEHIHDEHILKWQNPHTEFKLQSLDKIKYQSKIIPKLHLTHIKIEIKELKKHMS